MPVMIPAGAVNNTGGSFATTLFEGEHAVKNLAVSGTHMVTKDIPNTAHTAKYNIASIIPRK
jgi:hypothetical protein